jgi:EAL domain-containing protein (putative c-di-GMP-specific phosphodiesterase class I)
MTAHWNRIHHAAGTTIFREGEHGEEAYLIERGVIDITTNSAGQVRHLATLRDGELFGEIALFDKLTRTATATASEDTTLIPITWELILRKLNHSDPLLAHLLEVVVARFRNIRDGVERNPRTDPGQEDGSRRDHAVGQLKTAQGLSDALENHEFQLHYQPVVRLDNGSLVGFEALIRWNRPNIGCVSPQDFIGIAEDTGLIVPIGRWVLREAIAALSRLQAAMDLHHPGNQGLFMSINLSAQQIQEMGEVGEIIDLVRASGVDASRLKLEITESALLDDPELAALALQKLKTLGLQLAIDDFGTGYSSLHYLGQFPLDTLKIAHTFVASMCSSESSRRITRAITGLARDLNMNCIGEGIESADEIALLRQMGCEYGQGYYFAKPRSEARMMEYIAASR